MSMICFVQTLFFIIAPKKLSVNHNIQYQHKLLKIFEKGQVLRLLLSKTSFNSVASWHSTRGPSIKDVSPNFRFLGYPPSLCLLKSTSERLLFGHFLYLPPTPFGETSFMDGPQFCLHGIMTKDGIVRRLLSTLLEKYPT